MRTPSVVRPGGSVRAVVSGSAAVAGVLARIAAAGRVAGASLALALLLPGIGSVVPRAATPGVVDRKAAPGWAGAVALASGVAAQETGRPGADALALARAHARTGRYEEAERAFRDAAASGAGWVARREHARLLVRLARYDDAVDLLDGAGTDPRTETALLNARGEALMGLGRLDEAERAFRLAEERGAPDHLTARKNLGLLLLHRGERERAREIFDSFIDVYNGSADLTAEELLAVGVAVEHLGARDPDLFRDALMAYDEAAEADPADLRPDLHAGRLFLAKYNAPEAHASFDEVLAIDPRHPEALLGKARTIDFDGAPGAMERVERALEVAPGHPDVRAFEAALHLGAEDHARAIEEAERALATNPKHLDALAVLAAAHYLDGEEAAYRDARDRALAVNPTWAGLWVRMAELAAEQRRYHEAVDLAGRAVALDSTSWEAFGILGMNQLRTGRIEEGRRSLERAFAGDPYNPWFKNSLDLLDTFDRYESVRTEHFDLFIRSDEAGVLGPYAAGLAERAYGALAERYGAEPPTPVRVEIFPSHADFSVRTLGLVGLGALGVSFGSTLVMDSPSARDPGDFNWESTLWHELAHAFHLAISDHRVPRWFSEGLSVYEQRKADPRWGPKPTTSWLRSYAAGRMPPVSRLNEAFVRPEYPEQVIHGYFQASLVFEMIEERWGWDAVLSMLRGYRDGSATDALVERVLGVEPGALDEAFDAWVRDRYRSRMAAVEPLGEEAHPGADAGHLRSLARRQPGSFQARHAYGVALFRAGDLDAAEEELTAALRLFPEHGGAEGPLRFLARIHEARGDTERAAEALARLGELGESLPEVHVEEARLRLETGDTAAAVGALEKAVQITPFERELHRRLAEAYRSTGDAAGEVRERRALLALEPTDRARALYDLAAALHRAGDTEGARDRIVEALEIAPTWDEALDLLLEIRGAGP